MEKDFLNKIFKELKQQEPSLTHVNPEAADFLLASKYEQIWSITIDIYDQVNSLYLYEDLNLFIGIDINFPHRPPKIHIDRETLRNIGTIPHMSFSESDICIFDSFVIFDSTNPVGIIKEAIQKAIITLEEGLSGRNYEDFKSEYLAYWERQTHSNDLVFSDGLYTVIEREPENWNSVVVIEYLDAVQKNNQFLFFNKEENLHNLYSEFLKHNKVTFLKYSAFYVGEPSDLLGYPPFEISLEESLKYIPTELESEFKRFFNSHDSKFVLFKKEVEGDTTYLGWYYPELNLKFPGFRKLKPYDVAFKKIFPPHKKHVKRISTQKLNSDRLYNRTSGGEFEEKAKSFGLIGLGSVGSNLLYFLNQNHFPNTVLVDNDTLNAENLGRHLLGFEYLRHNKASACENYLKKKLPSQITTSYPTDIVKVLENKPDAFDDVDYIFFCIGIQNLDKWIINKLRAGEINKPVFLIWVEPYLIGGQLLYIHPNTIPQEAKLYEDVYKYKYSVISPEEFQNKREVLIKRESGCQSVFSPYTANQLILFLSNIYQQVNVIMKENIRESKAITWIGDETIADRLGIERRYTGSFITRETTL